MPTMNELFKQKILGIYTAVNLLALGCATKWILGQGWSMIIDHLSLCYNLLYYYQIVLILVSKIFLYTRVMLQCQISERPMSSDKGPFIE